MGRIVVLILMLLSAPVFAVQKVSIEYNPQINYSKIDSAQIEKEAYEHYIAALNTTTDGESTDAEKALVAYQILFAKHPNNVLYCVKIAELYSITNNSKRALEHYYKAITLNNTSSIAFESFGNFFFSNRYYKQALTMYKQSYSLDKENYNVSDKMGIIYQKFGDTQAALKHHKEAYQLNPSEELAHKIRLLEELNLSNTVYYQNTKAHFVEE